MNKIIVCVCVCVCVSNTTKLQKDYIFKMSFFLWLETGGFSETGKCLIVNVYECLRGQSMMCYLMSVKSHWRACVAAAKKLCEKRKSVWKRRIYRKYASWKGLQTQDENLRADVVLRRSRGSSGFPRLNMCASAIFVVGTSGIPPILNYRSVKSYKLWVNYYH